MDVVLGTSLLLFSPDGFCTFACGSLAGILHLYAELHSKKEKNVIKGILTLGRLLHTSARKEWWDLRHNSVHC